MDRLEQATRRAVAFGKGLDGLCKTARDWERQAENGNDNRARQGHTSIHRSAPPKFSGFFF
jgi:hypothetical protein